MSMPMVSTPRVSWTGHFLENRLRPVRANPAVRTSSPRISANGNPAGGTDCDGWPVAARSAAVAGWLVAVDGAAVAEGPDDGTAVAAGASAAVWTSITRRVGPLS